MSRMDLTGCVADIRLCLFECSLLRAIQYSRVRVRIGVRIRLVSCYAHVYVLLYVVTVTDRKICGTFY